jgi:hypothetical protein
MDPAVVEDLHRCAECHVPVWRGNMEGHLKWHHLQAAALDDLTTRVPELVAATMKDNTGPDALAATPARAHAINARQLQDLIDLEDLLGRAGIDVASQYSTNPVGVAVALARRALEHLHDALMTGWDASLRPEAVVKRMQEVEASYAAGEITRDMYHAHIKALTGCGRSPSLGDAAAAEGQEKEGQA